MAKAINYIGKALMVLGVVFGLLGISSVWKDYTYRKASVVIKAQILSVEIKDIRVKHGNYYLKPTHHIDQQLTFLRDGSIDTITLKSNFILYTEARHLDNPNPVPTVEKLMNKKKYVRYVPTINKNETAFPDRIDINDNGEYEAQHKISYFFNMLFCFIFSGILHLFFRTKKSR
ncbi:MAG TPA: hypothetical protein PKD42_17015 [Chitinophagaceae bacterium]|jgi:hypothetical protein|nr:hypothetical protein [Chitinophagaceae bacterium]